MNYYFKMIYSFSCIGLIELQRWMWLQLFSIIHVKIGTDGSAGKEACCQASPSQFNPQDPTPPSFPLTFVQWPVPTAPLNTHTK